LPFAIGTTSGPYHRSATALARDQAMRTTVSALTVATNTVIFIVSTCLRVTRSRFAGGRLPTFTRSLERIGFGCATFELPSVMLASVDEKKLGLVKAYLFHSIEFVQSALPLCHHFTQLD